MGKVDISAKAYMSVNERFADLGNYYLFQGKQVINPKDLQEMDTTELLVVLEEGKHLKKQNIRDLLKKAVIKFDGRVCYALLGVENQMEVNLAMPLRNMTFDAMRYCKQVTEIAAKHKEEQKQGKEYKTTSAEFLSGLHYEDKLVPIITMTLHLGKNDWNGPMSLHEMLDIEDEELLKYIADYKLNLITPQNINNFEVFKSDLGEVLKVIKVSDNRKEMAALLEQDDTYRHLKKDAAILIKDCTGMDINIDGKKEEFDMCQAWEEQKALSHQEGREEGREEGRKNAILEMVQDGDLTIEKGAKKLDFSVEELIDCMKKRGFRIPC